MNWSNKAEALKAFCNERVHLLGLTSEDRVKTAKYFIRILHKESTRETRKQGSVAVNLRVKNRWCCDTCAKHLKVTKEHTYKDKLHSKADAGVCDYKRAVMVQCWMAALFFKVHYNYRQLHSWQKCDHTAYCTWGLNGMG